MARPIIDLTNQRFGKLIPVSIHHKENYKTFWNCKCDCGSPVVKNGVALREGILLSCGCNDPIRYNDLTGKKVGRLTVIRVAAINPVKWLCKCECGKEKVVWATSLGKSATLSCGCLQKERVAQATKTHGHNHNNSAEYRCWCHIKARCLNPNVPDFYNYGGRGIEICSRWSEKFENFLEDMGIRPSPKHSIDRYPDVNGNYEKANCRWATKKEQAQGRRNTRWLEYGGERMTMKDWADRLGVNSMSILGRIKKGQSFEEIYNHFKKV